LRLPWSPLFPSTTLFRSSAVTTSSASTAFPPRVRNLSIGPSIVDVVFTLIGSAARQALCWAPRKTPGALQIASQRAQTGSPQRRSEEHTSELQSPDHLVC